MLNGVGMTTETKVLYADKGKDISMAWETIKLQYVTMPKAEDNCIQQ